MSLSLLSLPSDSLHSLLEEHIQALKMGALMTLAALFIATRLNFFKMPKKSIESFLPMSYTMGAFILYLLLSIVIVPFIAVKILSYIQGIPVNVDKISVETESWINIGLIGAAAIGLGVYLLGIPSSLKRTIFGQNAFISVARSIKDYGLGMGTWFIAFPCTLLVSQILAIITLLFFPGPVKEQVAVMYVRLAQSSPTLFGIMAATFVFLVPLVEETPV